MKNFLHWQETPLLRAFLTGNKSIEILFSLSMLHYANRKELALLFAEYEPQNDYYGIAENQKSAFENLKEHFPSSIYLITK